VRVVRHFEPRGKFAALKAGVMAARGQWIFQTDSDLPFAMTFFDEAAALLERGFEFVAGNRRRTNSVYVVPSHLLTRFLLRDFLGRMLNIAARILLPSIQVKDTQAGIKAMTTRFAKLAFEAQDCPGFYGDLEILLFAIQNEFRYTDLPVRLEVNDSKSSVRIAREIWKTLYWLFRIASNYRKGRYRLKRDRLKILKSSASEAAPILRDRSIAGQH
jgi:glycosyltransferase involved in cell wall biosynthesis